MKPVIVIHYHELWLKGGNRNFFLAKLAFALRRTLEGIPIRHLRRPGDRMIIELAEGASVTEAVDRLRRVFGIANFAVAKLVQRTPESDADPALPGLCRAAWEEIEPLDFSTFAVRAKRSDKTFPHRATDIESTVGRHVLEKLRAAGRNVRVHLNDPEVTCRIEITPGPLLVYARRISGAGGMPANTAGRMVCLLSGGFDSAVAAYKLMKRGAHMTFVHFWGGGARPGESSLHVARELARKLTPLQFTSKLYLVPFEPIQREIVSAAPETFRLLLYRRLMLRIAEAIGRRNRVHGVVTGDSLGQVASQTLQNMAAVGSVATMPLFRPLAGDDKQEILDLARRIGTYEISAEPFHDCCPVFLPRVPALFASAEELDAAESTLDIARLVQQGVQTATVERFRYAAGRVEQVSTFRAEAASKAMQA